MKVHYFVIQACVFLLLFLSSLPLDAKNYRIQSPNQQITLSIELPEQLTNDHPARYQVSVNNQLVISNASAWLTLESKDKTPASYQLNSVKTDSVNQIVYPVVKQKSAEIIDNYHEIVFSFTDKLSLTFRVFNNGVAYRFSTTKRGSFNVLDELALFRFTNNTKLLFPEEKSFISHNERLYLEKMINEVSEQQFASLPLLATSANVKVVLTESALKNYPGMWLKGQSNNALAATFARYVLSAELKDKSDRNENILARADYIATYPDAQHAINFPWRIMAIAQHDEELLTNQLSYLLAEPTQLTDTSWIKPGQVAWDWWNANNIYGVDFKSGINTATYKYYIDFAAKYGIDYILLDEGWYQLGDVLAISPNIDVKEIIRYGKSKGVDVILWVIWQTLDQQLEKALDTYQAWGAAGIKVDFMQRDDQTMVQYYWRVAEQAAKRQLLVDFHGSYKPAGLRRTYPNVITREGVRGLEHNKWADYITSRHNLTLPFIRMLAGPMDYTPGAMINAQPKNFNIVFDRPMSKTTRAHQVAMYVVFESPLQMLADSPSNYLKEHQTTEFISDIPTVWDETKVLSATIGEHIITARRSKDTWFIGAMGNEQAQDHTIDLSFLATGKYAITCYQDGINADKYASDYRITQDTVSASNKLTIKLAANGGWVAKITKIKQ